VLGSGIGGTARHAADAGARRGIHHHAAALAHHLRDLVLHADEGAAQVNVEDAIPLLQLDFVKRRRLVLDAGVVECAVDAAVGFDCLCDCSLDFFRLRHITGDRQHFGACRLHVLCGLLQRRLAPVRDHDARSFGRERDSGRAADAAGGSGDECSLAFKAF
jgi:hypothetical protein